MKILFRDLWYETSMINVPGYFGILPYIILVKDPQILYEKHLYVGFLGYAIIFIF